jgi:hypothetical protein
MASPKSRTVPVSERALIQRINRALAKEGEKLKKSRGVQTGLSIGQYYVLDLQRNFVRHQSVDPEDLGRQLNVLQPYEHLSEEN